MRLPSLPLVPFPPLNFCNAFLLVGTAAIIVHLIYKKFEIQPSSFIQTSALLFGIPYLASSFLVPHFSVYAVAYLVGFAAFYGSLLTSIAIYRLSPWHPLAKYPGPMVAKLSKFWSIWLLLRNKRRETMLELHRKLGPYVRIGPNELSLVDVDLLPALVGPDMPKGPLYDGRRNPDVPASLLVTRSHSEHARLRIPWAHALSVTSVRNYEPVIIKRARQLAEELEKQALAGKAINLVTYMSYFAFDFMGDMAFGGGFELMRDGDVSGLWKIMMNRIQEIAWQMQIPWAMRFLLKVPFGASAVTKFRSFAVTSAKKRLKKGAATKDLFYYLMLEDQDDTIKVPTINDAALSGELAIVAGSDTTSTTLGNIFYYLMTNPEYYARLRKEVDEMFPPGEEEPIDGARLAQMIILNAVINEALRLQPALATNMQRAPEKGSGGKWVGEHFLSENTAVNTPPYVYHHDKRYFYPLTDTFWPDRWLQDSKKSEKSRADGSFIHNVAAFIPFSAGFANCVGKTLALAELRMVVALLVQRFDMSFAEGYDPRRWESEIQDLFGSKLGELPVVLKLRV